MYKESDNQYSTPDLDAYASERSRGMLEQIETYFDDLAKTEADHAVRAEGIASEASEYLATAPLDETDGFFDLDIEMYESREVLKSIIRQNHPDLGDNYGRVLVDKLFSGFGQGSQAEQVLDDELNIIIAQLDERVYYDETDDEIKARKLALADKFYFHYDDQAVPLVGLCDAMNSRGIEISSIDRHEIHQLNLDINAINPEREEIYFVATQYIKNTEHYKVIDAIESTIGRHDDGREVRLAEAIIDIGIELAIKDWEILVADDIDEDRLQLNLDFAIKSGEQRLNMLIDNTTALKIDTKYIDQQIQEVYQSTQDILGGNFC